jgi:hypothetical protein
VVYQEGVALNEKEPWPKVAIIVLNRNGWWEGKVSGIMDAGKAEM